MGKKKIDTNSFKTGNVVRLKGGGIVILTGYRTMKLENSPSYRVMDWVSFNHSNTSGGTREFTIDEECMCWECGINDGGAPEGCKTCNDTGRYMGKRYGMDKAERLAGSVKDYILSRLTKNFDF